MKNNYGKDTNTKYQATGKENTRNPNAPTQGGFSTPGGGQGKNLNDKSKNPQSKQPNQPWGTGSIDKNKDKGDRR